MPGGRTRWRFPRRGWTVSWSRPEDFARFVGSRVELTTREPIEGNRTSKDGWKGMRDGTDAALESKAASRAAGAEGGN